MYASRTMAVVGIGSALMTAGTTLSAVSASASTLTCTKQPSIVQTAPAVGGSTTVTTSVGHYTVSRSSTALTASAAVANTGWTATINIPTGARVRVTYKSTSTTSLDRFTTSLNGTGLKLITHVVACS